MVGKMSFVSRILQGVGLHKKTSHTRSEAVNDAIEKVVDGTDARIRYLGGYKRKLRGVVESSYAYFDMLVTRIPGVIEINKGAFTADPRVHAFFITIEDLQNKFSRSSELRHFIEEEKNKEVEDVFALLCMEKTEKTVFGMELKGDVIKRDVAQISVGFTDHQLLAPASSEREARQGLRECLFEQLIIDIMNDIKSLQARQQDFEAQRRILLTQKRALEAKKRRSASSSESMMRKEHKINKKLEENKKAIDGVKSKLVPRCCLDHACEILSHPEDHISVRRLDLNLNNMGIKQREDSSEPGNEINLAEMKLGKTPSRVVVLAKYPRNEILPKEDFLERVTPYLSP